MIQCYWVVGVTRGGCRCWNLPKLTWADFTSSINFGHIYPKICFFFTQGLAIQVASILVTFFQKNWFFFTWGLAMQVASTLVTFFLKIVFLPGGSGRGFALPFTKTCTLVLELLLGRLAPTQICCHPCIMIKRISFRV